MRKILKVSVLTAALAAAGALTYTYSDKDRPAAPKAPPRHVAATVATPPQSAAAVPAGPALPAREGLGDTESPLFSSHSWEPPPPKVKPGPPPPPPKPVAPPLPYTFVGRMLQDGTVYVFLAQGDKVITAKQGDTIDGVYRVEAITETQVTLSYVPLGEKQSLAVVSSLPRGLGPNAAAAPAPAAAPAQPQPRAAAPAIPTSKVVASAPPPAAAGAALAQLEWGGPAKVRVGTSFDVSLKVKASDTLHAWPLQLRFDPAVFDVLTVKPGNSIAGPNFGYRVNEDGSIFVGASAQSGTPASNAELVVVTLKPLKPAPAAEINLTSLTLQGPAGRPIAYERIAAFKTAVVP